MDRGITLNWTAVGVIFAIFLSIIGAVYSIASKDAADDRQDRDISQLQTDSRSLTTDLAAIKTSTAKIEAKFEILVPSPKERK